MQRAAKVREHGRILQGHRRLQEEQDHQGGVARHIAPSEPPIYSYSSISTGSSSLADKSPV